jgi:hypothetical protein
MLIMRTADNLRHIATWPAVFPLAADPQGKPLN